MPNINTIIINGLGTSGKSTFCSFCTDYCNRKGYTLFIRELASVDVIKKVAESIGWNGSKEQVDRTMLSDLKRVIEQYNDLPVRSVVDTVEQDICQYSDQVEDFIFFINSREPYDMNRFKQIFSEKGYNTMVVEVENNNIENNEVPYLTEGIENYNYDKVIDNNGTLGQLYDQAGKFIEEILSSQVEVVETESEN